jgi:hypothetical protein
MPQLSVCTRKWGLIRSTIPVPRSPQPPAEMPDEIRPFSRTLTPGIPASAERATVEGTDHLGHGTQSSSAATIEVIGQQTLQDRLSLGSGYQLGSYTRPVTDDGSAIAAAIREGRCVSVSDGSSKINTAHPLGHRSRSRVLTDVRARIFHQ